MENTSINVLTYVTSFRDNHANTAHIDERVKGNRITEAHSRTDAHLGREENTSLCSPDALNLIASVFVLSCHMTSRSEIIGGSKSTLAAFVRFAFPDEREEQNEETNDDEQTDELIVGQSRDGGTVCKNKRQNGHKKSPLVGLMFVNVAI